MDQEPLKIEIGDETPLQAEISENPSSAQRIAQTAVSSTQKAWQSETRKKVTGKISAGAVKGAQLVQDRVAKAAADQARAQMNAAQTRIRETNWKEVAQTKASAALRWSSDLLDRLASRLTPTEKPPGQP
jgi:hypothetical protein